MTVSQQVAGSVTAVVSMLFFPLAHRNAVSQSPTDNAFHQHEKLYIGFIIFLHTIAIYKMKHKRSIKKLIKCALPLYVENGCTCDAINVTVFSVLRK